MQNRITLFVVLSLCLCIAGANAQIVKINFQPVAATVPVGYLPDTGDVFADRGNGYSYGFNAATFETIQRNSHSDPRYDTFNHIQQPSNPWAIWEIALPNDTYEVHLVCGDPDFDNQFNTIDVEGTVLTDPGLSYFDEYDLTVTVSDGRLTIKPSFGAGNAKLCFVDIRLEGYNNESPWVDAGDDTSIIWPGVWRVSLDADVYDDDPDEIGPPTLQWSKVSGPGNVIFVDGADVEDPNVAFTAPGAYTLQLEATDEVAQTGTDTVLINVDETELIGDVDGDGDVDLDDVLIMAQLWLGPGNNTADLDGNDTITLGDFNRLAGNFGRRVSPVKINEFMATNSYTPAVSPLDIYTHYQEIPGTKVHPDWIELYNSDPVPVSLEGWYLTDNRDNLTKWRFPSGVTIAADGYLVVFASNKDEVEYPYPFVDNDGALHTNFELDGGGEYLALVQTDGQMIAHEYDEYPKQRGLISYGIATDDRPGYLLNPTPGSRVSNRWRGAANSARYLGVVGDTQFSNDRGFYDSPFNVTISCPTADIESGVAIRYTLDGSTPTLANGQTYTSPINITTTTCLRAAAFKTDWLATNVDTQTYIFLDDVVYQSGTGFPGNWGHDGGDYEMDLAVVTAYAATIKNDLLSIPTMSLVMDVDDWFNPSTDPSIGGIYTNAEIADLQAWQRHVSVEFIDPANGDDFQLNAGVQIQGGTGTINWKMDKLSMRLKFKGGYGPSKLNYPLYGKDAADSFNTLILEARMNYSWPYGGRSSPDEQRARAQYTRDQYVADVQNAMGGFGPHGRHIHLYINGLYWGLYNLHERPDHSFAESYLGGDDYDYDVLKHTWSTIVSGTNANYNAMFTVSRRGLSGATRYQEIQEYLDVPNLIDYMITNFYVGNSDWDHKNWYATRNRRDPEGRWRYHSWDAEKVLKSVTHTTGFDDNNPGAPSELHQDLMANEEYLMLFADHLHRHFNNGGVLTVPSATALYQNLLDAVNRAVVGESARWGDNRVGTPYTRNVDWVAEKNWLLSIYFPARTSFVLTEHFNRGLWPSVSPPSFNQHGGSVPSNFDLEITAAAGTIYYTIDGSDPRATGGAPAGTVYSVPIPLTKSVVAKARARNSGTWSALNEATFTVGAVFDNLRITELMYHPTDPIQAEKDAAGDQNLIDEDFEFIELKNIGVAAINLNFVHFTDGIDFTFGDYSLAAGDYTVLVKHQAAFAARYGTGMNIVPGSYIGSLSNSGEEIVLRDAVGAEIHDFDYNDTWYDITDGGGFSLTIRDADAVDPDLWDQKAGWRPSAAVDGSPGWDDTGDIPEIGAIVINEILAHSDSSPNDWIELYNTTGSPINISDWYLSDNAGDLTKYKIAPSTTIPADGYIVFTQDADFGGAFALSENGETLYLHSGDGSGLTGYSEEESFGASKNNVAFGRYGKSTGTFNFVAMSSNTPGGSYEGAANAYPKVGPIVINEIMYHPTDSGGDAEYLELFNTSGGSVTLYDGSISEPWKMTDGIEYTFPSGSPTTISAGDYFLLIKDLTAFTAEYGAPVCDYAVWTSGSLSNGGEKVEISLPGDEDAGTRYYIRVDRINYSDGSHPVGDDPWPTDPDGTGTSLSRILSLDYGNDVINWQSAIGTPGVLNVDPTAPTVINAAATNITFNSARLNGEVTDNGGENPTVTVYWGDNDGVETLGNWDNADVIGTQNSTFIDDISSLSASTTYYFRAYASNSAGSDWADSTASFVTDSAPLAPTVVNAAATSITFNSAMLNGEVTDNGGQNPTVIVYWGDNDGGTTLGSWDNPDAIGTQSSTFIDNISSLLAGTTYYFRCYAVNSGGSDWADSTDSFVTDPPPVAPTVINAAVTNITSDSARLNGEVTDTGGEAPTVMVYWGDEDGGTTPSNWDNADDTGAQSTTFINDISSLSADTTYYFRCYAINSGGSDWADSTASFATDPVSSAPTVVNAAATSITAFTARLNGEVTDNGGENPTVTVYWGDNDGGTTPSSWDNPDVIGTRNSTFFDDISSLSVSTTYYFRAYASNSAGSDWANSTASFATASAPTAPTVVNAAATSITFNSARLNGEVTDNGNDDPTVTVYWGDNDGGTTPGNWDNADVIGTQNSTFIDDISSLSASTTYYFRAYASNSAGSDWANSTASFATTAPPPTAPTVINAAATNITSNSARLNGEVTDNGNENPTVTVYWGDNDGGTTPGNWDNADVIGTRNSTFFDDISSLSVSTTYYFRAYASNSAGSDWANSTAQFDTTAVPSDVEQIGSWVDGAWNGYSHTTPAGSNRVLLVFCHSEANAAPTDFTAVTYGGQALTQAVEKLQNQDSSYSATAEIWILNEAGIQAASGSTIVVTSSGAAETRRISSIFYENVNQADPVGQIGTDGENNNDQQTLTVTLSGGELDAGDMVVANCSVRNDQSGDTSFTWQNGMAAIGTYIAGDPYLNYSDADQLADATSETASVEIANNGVGALAVCALNHN